MQLGNSDFSLTSYPTPRSMRHFPRAPSQGLNHAALLIIITVAAVGGIALTILIWRILSRLQRPKSAPLPPRQSLVHERELHLAEFTELKDASMPETLVNGVYIIHGTDETTLNSSNGVKLHPPSPQFFSSEPHTPSNGSSSSLPSANDDSSSANTPPTQLSTSSLNQSPRRALNHSGSDPRPLSTLSTFSVSSRPSIRAAPHAPHSNVQIVLPTPLGPSLYKDGLLVQRTLTPNYTYSARDSWRRSLADTWISVGQGCLPDPNPVERQHGDERPARLIRRESSPGPRLPRSRSNPSSLSHLRPSSGLDQLPEGTYPPVPRTPSEFGTLSGPSPPSTDSHKPRS